MPSPVLQIRLSPESLEEVKRRGGSSWARDILLEALAGVPRDEHKDTAGEAQAAGLPAPEGETPLTVAKTELDARLAAQDRAHWPGDGKREPALPWSIICSRRDEHRVGIPCPECKGTGPR